MSTGTDCRSAVNMDAERMGKPSRTVVLGIGNRLMGDDGIGVRIVEALGKENTAGQIHYAAGETDINYCLDALEDVDCCIIADGAFSGMCRPGCIRVYDLKEVLQQKRPVMSFHDFDLIQAMKCGNMMKDGILIAIEIGSVELSAALSPMMQERFDALVREAGTIIDNYLMQRNDEDE